MLSLEIIKAALKHTFTELKALVQQHFLHFIYKGTGLGNKTYVNSNTGGTKHEVHLLRSSSSHHLHMLFKDVVFTT